MDRNHYRQYYHLERSHWWFRIREKILYNEIKKWLPKLNAARILNVGSATGRSSEMLQAFGEVTSIEYDKECCRFCNEELKISTIQASLLDMPVANNSYDLVCAFDVIEHIEDDQAAVLALHRVCKKGGLVFISVPAFQSLWSRHDEINHHFRRYRKGNLMILLNGIKASVLRISYFNALLFPIIFLFRKAQQVFHSKMQENDAEFTSDFDKHSLDKWFEKVFSLEPEILKKINFPAGVSLMLIWQKLD